MAYPHLAHDDFWQEKERDLESLMNDRQREREYYADWRGRHYAANYPQYGAVEGRYRQDNDERYGPQFRGPHEYAAPVFGANDFHDRGPSRFSRRHHDTYDPRREGRHGQPAYPHPDSIGRSQPYPEQVRRYPGSTYPEGRHSGGIEFDAGRFLDDEFGPDYGGNFRRGPHSDPSGWDQAAFRSVYDQRPLEHYEHAVHPDHDYYQWRSEQIKNLDRDYDEWRRERYHKFSNDFNNWRDARPLQDSSQAETLTGLGRTEPGATASTTIQHGNAALSRHSALTSGNLTSDTSTSDPSGSGTKL